METQEAFQILDKKIDQAREDNNEKFKVVFDKLDEVLKFKWKVVGSAKAWATVISVIVSVLVTLFMKIFIK